MRHLIFPGHNEQEGLGTADERFLVGLIEDVVHGLAGGEFLGERERGAGGEPVAVAFGGFGLQRIVPVLAERSPHGIEGAAELRIRPNALRDSLVDREGRVGKRESGCLCRRRSDKRRQQRIARGVTEGQTVCREVRAGDCVEAFETGGAGFPDAAIPHISGFDDEVTGDLALKVYGVGVNAAGAVGIRVHVVVGGIDLAGIGTNAGIERDLI